MIAVLSSALAAPVERALQAEVHPAGFAFVASALTAAPLEVGPAKIETEAGCYHEIVVRNFNLSVEVESLEVDLQPGRLGISLELGTVVGKDLDVHAVSGYLDLCLDFDAVVESIGIRDGRLEGVLVAELVDGEVVLAFQTPPTLTGTFDSDIAWFPDDLAWSLFGDLALEQASQALADLLPGLLAEPTTFVLGPAFGDLPVEMQVSEVDVQPTGLYGAVDVDLSGQGASGAPRLELGPRGDSHVAVGLTDALATEVLATGFAEGLLSPEAPTTAPLLADLLETLGLDGDVTASLGLGGPPAVTSGSDGTRLHLTSVALSLASDGEQVLDLVGDLDAALDLDVDPARGEIVLGVHDVAIDVLELDVSHLVQDEDGEAHLAAFLEGWVGGAVSTAVSGLPVFSSRYALYGWVIRLDELESQSGGIASWFTVFDADDPAVDLVPPDTAVEVAGGVAAWTGSDDRPGPLLFSWRVDDGAWSAWSAAGWAPLGGQTPGEHTVEVRARDGWQNEDPTPAVARFEAAAAPTSDGCGCGTAAGPGWWVAILALLFDTTRHRLRLGRDVRRSTLNAR